MQQRNYALSWPAEKDDGCASDAPFRVAGRYEFQIPPRRFLRSSISSTSFRIQLDRVRAAKNPSCPLPRPVFTSGEEETKTV